MWLVFTQRDMEPVRVSYATSARTPASARNKAAGRGVKDIVDVRCVDDSLMKLLGEVFSKGSNVPRTEM